LHRQLNATPILWSIRPCLVVGYIFTLFPSFEKKGGEMRTNSPLERRVNARFGGVRIPIRRRILLGIILLVGGPVISTTLATTLTITGTNGRTAVEFGQGSQIAIGCDTTINTAITEVWETNTTRFRVEKVVLSGVNLKAVDTATVNDSGCGNRDIKLSVVDTQTGQLFIGNGDTGTVVTVSFGTGGATSARSTQNILGGTISIDTTTAGLSLETATVTFTLPHPLRLTNGNVRNTPNDGTNNNARSLDPSNIARVAIETMN